ncbi:viroplasmin family protein [Anaerosphaera multitolerans]|uniref:ribonuclease H n=1 Tax=Anaerosphaera multitolerans TaxID=2487351 RepID=A0A437S9Q6_9FIRM|nr:ribonuclease H family protein [Anaerosphaera multitolerans]RVU55574.1 RNase H [Anaerosphaera multitolerans]
MNYYAVKKGKAPGIYNTWDECKEQVSGYSGAIYKKFSDLDEAKAFIEESIDRAEEERRRCGDDEIIAYVDGSYDDSNKSFSYGAILFDGGEIYETHSKRFYNNEDATMRNVSGEIEGAMYAMKRAVELGKKVLYLHYDYFGIENWALGNWKANKEGTIKYRDFYREISKNLKVIFIKVKAHSGVEYNEVVDKLAKEAK